MNSGTKRSDFAHKKTHTRSEIIQINMDRSRTTLNLVHRYARDEDIHLIIIAEPNKKAAISQGWYADEKLDAAIVVPSGKLAVKKHGRGSGYVWVETTCMAVYSCYISPSVDLKAATLYMAKLANDIRRHNRPVIVAGDFNAKSTGWGSDFCALVTLDVKNAFNVARWSGTIEVMESKKIDRYLIEVVRSYLTNRILNVGDRGNIHLTCGVPQGSVLGPLLWNMYFDDVFRVEMSAGVTLIGYADDLALVAVGRSGILLTHTINTEIGELREWLKGKKLTIAAEKTEVVLLSGRRKLREITVTVGDKVVTSKESLKYLGIIFDRNMTKTEHIKQTVTRVNEVAAKLGRLMPNIGGPRSSKRRVLSGAINSVILYGAPVWSETMKKEKYKNMLQQVQRKMALKVSSAYRTVSAEAAQVLPGLIPIDLQVIERTRAYDTQTESKALRHQTMTDWQNRWRNLRGKA